MMIRSALAPIASVWIVVLAGIIAAWGSASLLGISLTLLFVGTLSSIVAGVWAYRRIKGVQRLDRFARRLIAEAQPDQPKAAPVIDSDADDAAELGRTLADLQQAMRTQTRELAKKSRNLESLVDGLDEPVLVFDNADCVLLNNRAAEEMLGARRGSLIGRGLREIFTRAEIATMHAAARQGEIRRGRVPMLTPAGPRTFQVSATPLPPAWGQGVFGSVIAMRDVTELSQAVQLKSDFVASASHELRTPVAAIRAAVETLIDGAKDEPAIRDRMLKMIESHTMRLDEMVRDLLDLSRLESPDMPVRIGEIDLDDLRISLEQLFDPVLKERKLTLEFSLEFATADLPLYSDGRLLLLILRNLVENSCKNAFEGTAIKIAGRMVSPPEDAPAPADGTLERWARFEVTDKGKGIPLAHQERVFERFYQIDPARTGSVKRGTGLGLAIVKHAARSMSGRVGLQSEWGQGTTVWFEAPVGNPGGSVGPGGSI